MIHTCIGGKNYVLVYKKFTGWKEVVPGVLEPMDEEIPSHCSVNDDMKSMETFQQTN